MSNVVVLGAGSWGTALALMLHSQGKPVLLWSRDGKKIDAIREAGENRTFLPDIPIPSDLPMTSDLAEALSGAGEIVLAVPSTATCPLAKEIARLAPEQASVILTAKGFEPGKGRRLSEAVSDEVAPARITVLAGPSHAEEVALRVPTTVVVAGFERSGAERTQKLFSTDRFRVYTNRDLTGVEIATALKNIIALAAGISDGLGFGDNAKGALLTRGLAEITRLGIVMGAQENTFAGLAGMGDLVTTCISRHSRNRHFGEAIARGKSVEQIQQEMVMVAEGVDTTRTAARLAALHGVEMPITTQMEKVLFHRKPPLEAMEDLMARDLKAEVW